MKLLSCPLSGDFVFVHPSFIHSSLGPFFFLFAHFIAPCPPPSLFLPLRMYMASVRLGSRDERSDDWIKNGSRADDHAYASVRTRYSEDRICFAATATLEDDPAMRYLVHDLTGTSAQQRCHVRGRVRGRHCERSKFTSRRGEWQESCSVCWPQMAVSGHILSLYQMCVLLTTPLAQDPPNCVYKICEKIFLTDYR